MSIEQTLATPQPKLFPLGQLLSTPGAINALRDSGQLPAEFLRRHQAGDWGDLFDADKRENEFSVSRELRILSSYRTAKDEKIWIITEADRSATTLLLPSEY